MSRRTWRDGRLVEEWDDNTRTYRRFDPDGALAEERAYTETEAAALVAADESSAREANRATLLAKVDFALAADLNYLELPSPTSAQVVAQVERLTRQAVALLRMVGDRLDDTAGT